MFCPKCGAEAVEVQRFCKLCGTNLQLINDALKSGDSGQPAYGVDIESLKRNAIEFAQSWKSGWSGLAPSAQRQLSRHSARRRIREEIRSRNLPRPREWMSYSWQHSLRNGLLSLFGGAGLGAALYYLGRTAINEGVLQNLEEATHGKVHGLEPLVRLLWVFALIPILKGLAQIFYSAFFAESMATLSERFTVKPPPEASAAPVEQPRAEPPAERFERLTEAPSSVTENTTKIFEEAGRRVTRETQ